MLRGLFNQLAVKLGAQLGMTKNQKEQRLSIGDMSVQLTAGTTVNDGPRE